LSIDKASASEDERKVYSDMGVPLREAKVFEKLYNESQSALVEKDPSSSSSSSSSLLSAFEQGQLFGAQIVFTHNDVLSYNIMIPADFFESAEEQPLTFIDFEYAGHNSRAFDIANHFCGKISYFESLFLFRSRKITN
jgi:thiamine kinase-like enzyme